MASKSSPIPLKVLQPVVARRVNVRSVARVSLIVVFIEVSIDKIFCRERKLFHSGNILNDLLEGLNCVIHNREVEALIRGVEIVQWCE